MMSRREGGIALGTRPLTAIVKELEERTPVRRVRNRHRTTDHLGVSRCWLLELKPEQENLLEFSIHVRARGAGQRRTLDTYLSDPVWRPNARAALRASQTKCEPGERSRDCSRKPKHAIPHLSAPTRS
jgi:hypothetical protein